jgi:hypothetical protein
MRRRRGCYCGARGGARESTKRVMLRRASALSVFWCGGVNVCKGGDGEETKSGNWRFAAEQGSQMAWFATTDVKVVCDLAPTRGSQKSETEKADGNATKK